MPIFFVGYALAVWIIAARYRRTYAAFIAVAGGLLGLMGLNFLHIKLNDWTSGDIYLPVLQSIMYPYTALVAGVGCYIAVLPQRSGIGCPKCGYDLHGLTRPGEPCRCPECGVVSGGPEPVYRASGADRDDLERTDVTSAGNHAVEDPAQKNEARNARDQAPAQA